MVYEKAMAEVILFDNSEVITASGCDNGNNKGQGHFHSGGNNGNGNTVNLARSNRIARMNVTE